jgi:hypothetical protein
MSIQSIIIRRYLIPCAFLGALFLIFLSTTGCTSYKGLIPNKDVRLENVRIESNTPWGPQTFEADLIDTRVQRESVP